MREGIKAQELIKSLGERCYVLGSENRYVFTPAPIDQAKASSLAFCSRAKGQALRLIRDSKAGVIICSDELEFSSEDYQYTTLIQVANPKLTFARLMRRYFVPAIEVGIHPSAVISQGADIHPQVYIGPNCSIGECRIGKGTVLYGNVYIHGKTKIGKGVVIHAGTVIGSEGFGLIRNESGELEGFPQIGGVDIGDNVEIGSNVSVDHGTLGDTIIGEGTKIDNLTHISHNVRIGKHCMVNALVVICGSVVMGDYSQVSPHSCVREQITIGHHAIVGTCSLVTKDVDDNMVVLGIPAKPHGTPTK